MEPAIRDCIMACLNPVFHICRAREWAMARESGDYNGSSQDVQDGFIHCSDAAQIISSAAKHRAGQDGLVLLWIDPALLKNCTLKREPSRDGQLFPHIYGPLNTDAVIRTDPLNLDAAGQHVFPDDLPGQTS